MINSWRCYFCGNDITKVLQSNVICKIFKHSLYRNDMWAWVTLWLTLYKHRIGINDDRNILCNTDCLNPQPNKSDWKPQSSSETLMTQRRGKALIVYSNFTHRDAFFNSWVRKSTYKRHLSGNLLTQWSLVIILMVLTGASGTHSVPQVATVLNL